MLDRIVIAVFAAALALGPVAAQAQTTPTKPAATSTAAKPATPAKATKADEEDDTPSSGEQKKACDAKWKVEKEKTKASGWKAYFTFMAKCM